MILESSVYQYVTVHVISDNFSVQPLLANVSGGD